MNLIKLKLEFSEYQILLPETWNIELHHPRVAIYNDSQGKGAMIISEYLIRDNNPKGSIELLREITSNDETDVRIYEHSNFGDAATCSLKKNGKVWKYWILISGRIATIVTYNCRLEYHGFEDADINSIIESIRRCN